MLGKAEKRRALVRKLPTPFVGVALLAKPAEAAMLDAQAPEIDGRREGRWSLDGEGG